ncbi:MAG: Ribonuclease [Candidatus Parcubacteria bacterium]
MKGDEIALLFSSAKMVRNPLFTMKYIKNETNKTSFAIAASKKVFKTAVLRNKVRRRLYGAIKTAKVDSLPYSVVILPNKEALNVPYKALVTAVSTSCKDLIKI